MWPAASKSHLYNIIQQHNLVCCFSVSVLQKGIVGCNKNIIYALFVSESSGHTHCAEKHFLNLFSSTFNVVFSTTRNVLLWHGQWVKNTVGPCAQTHSFVNAMLLACSPTTLRQPCQLWHSTSHTVIEVATKNFNLILIRIKSGDWHRAKQQMCRC